MEPDPEFEKLYQEEFLRVFQAAYLLTRDRRSAEDATQEAFARALEPWPRLRGQSWVGGWVARTAINTMKRSLRRRLPPAANAKSGPDPEDCLDLWTAVAALPARQRDSVVLVYRLGYSTEEAAHILDCPSGTVRGDLSRARQALAHALKEERHE
jgi:RNA polymerase sigma-70 factor (ECF subfamily)